MRVVLGLIALSFHIHSSQAKSFTKKISIQILGGFGRHQVIRPVTNLPDGTTIDFEQGFLKSFRFYGLTQVNRKFELGIDFGLTYDYQIGYTARVNRTSTGLSASLPDAGSEYYTNWHLIANCYRVLWNNNRWKLKGYGGAGIQLFRDGNYFKKEELQESDSKTKYYYQPSSVNNNPIIVFNAGLELHYKAGRRGTLFIQPSLQYATKPFIIETVRIETSNTKGEVLLYLKGTHALLSLGYSFAIHKR